MINLFLPVARLFVFGIILILGLSRLIYEIAEHLCGYKRFK